MGLDKNGFGHYEDDTCGVVYIRFDRNNLSVFCGCVFLFYIFSYMLLLFLVIKDGRNEGSNLTKMIMLKNF